MIVVVWRHYRWVAVALIYRLKVDNLFRSETPVDWVVEEVGDRVVKEVYRHRGAKLLDEDNVLHQPWIVRRRHAEASALAGAVCARRTIASSQRSRIVRASTNGIRETAHRKHPRSQDEPRVDHSCSIRLVLQQNAPSV